MNEGPVTGYEDALKELDRRIAWEIVRLRTRYALSQDEFHGLYISDEQVDALVQRLDPAMQDTVATMVPLSGLVRNDRWARVNVLFGLSHQEEEVLLLAMAPELDLKYERLYAYLNNDVTRPWPTLDMAERLLVDLGKRHLVQRALDASSPVSMHLIQEIEPPSGRPSRRNGGFVMAPSVSAFLRGERLATGGDEDKHSATLDPWKDLPL